WLKASSNHPQLQAPLIELLRKAGADVATGGRPAAEALIVVTPIGWDMTTAISDLHLDPERTFGVDVLFGMKGPRTLMTTPTNDPAARDSLHALLAADGQQVVVINDSPGFVAQRVVAMIVNVACGVAQRGIATPADIDKATQLGLGYPFGPLEWGDRIGPARILFILQRLHSFYGEPRYRPNAGLKRRPALGPSLRAPERRSAT